MILAQVENWIQYSDCILNNITYKTNYYDMILSLFVGFNNNHQNILLVQALLIDKSLDLHTWMFYKIIEATNIQLKVILTNANSAVDLAIHQIFNLSYPIHYTYHIIQNLHKNLKKSSGDTYQKFLKDFIIII